LKAGEELKKHFPWSEDDSNELSNEISKGYDVTKKEYNLFSAFTCLSFLLQI
jgi:hypothetical protein